MGAENEVKCATYSMGNTEKARIDITLPSEEDNK